MPRLTARLNARLPDRLGIPRRTPALLAALFGSLLASAAPVQARDNDFTTLERVLYVQECLRMHPGPNFEMVNKCVCAVDRLAAEVSMDDYISMATANNANSIGGERGNAIRDAESLQDEIKRYRALQTKVKKACFILP